MPRVSVIVPFRNRRDLLGNLLDGLEHQTFRDFEVVLIDDGSTDGAEAVAADRMIAGRPVTLVHTNGAGAVAARRVGVAEASGDILAFTDSDCRPCPEWLQRGVEGIDGGAVMVNGLTSPQRPVGPFERSMSSGLEGLYPTCNIFFRRSVFAEFGGLDGTAIARLGFRKGRRAVGLGFGEDTILAWKVKRSGLPTYYEPMASVEHHVFPPDLRESFSRALQAGAFPALVREIPELRETLLVNRAFLTLRRLPLYTAISAAVLRRRSVVFGALVWWALSRAWEVRALPRSRAPQFGYVPLLMAEDLVVGSALIAGSLKTRCWVL